MSNLSNKSEISLEAAKLLNDKCLYSSVAHCAYYACFQKSKHIWIHTQKRTEKELESLQVTSKRGSHEVLINEIASYIKNCKTISDHFRLYNNNIIQLKKLRTKADYDDTVFDSSDSANSLELSKKVMSVLNKII